MDSKYRAGWHSGNALDSYSGECRNSASVGPVPLLFISFPVHHSFVTLPFKVILCGEIAHKFANLQLLFRFHVLHFRRAVESGAGITQSVLRLATGRTTKGSQSRWGQEFSRLHVQTGSGVHPTSYPMGAGGSYPWGKETGAWNWPPAASAEVKRIWIYTSTPLVLN
jgi:hypothetical protein